MFVLDAAGGRCNIHYIILHVSVALRLLFCLRAHRTIWQKNNNSNKIPVQQSAINWFHCNCAHTVQCAAQKWEAGSRRCSGKQQQLHAENRLVDARRSKPDWNIYLHIMSNISGDVLSPKSQKANDLCFSPVTFGDLCPSECGSVVIMWIALSNCLTLWEISFYFLAKTDALPLSRLYSNYLVMAW